MTENDQLLASAVLGKQLENFLASDVGKYLQARANRVYNAAIDEFKSCNPSDTTRLVKIQADVWKAEAFMTWVSEGIQEGLTALGILEGVDDDSDSAGFY